MELSHCSALDRDNSGRDGVVDGEFRRIHDLDRPARGLLSRLRRELVGGRLIPLGLEMFWLRSEMIFRLVCPGRRRAGIQERFKGPTREDRSSC